MRYCATIPSTHCGIGRFFSYIQVESKTLAKRGKLALIQCPKCGSSVSSEATKCPHCEAKLSPLFTIYCPECSSVIRFNEWTCPYCGYKRSRILSYIGLLCNGCLATVLSAYLLCIAVAFIGLVIIVLYVFL